jgi:Sulfotransferase family
VDSFATSDKVPQFNADALLDAAMAATGFDDFGPDPFLPSLHVLLASLRDEAQLTPPGVEAVHLRLLKSLTDRLQIQSAIRAHPEILDEPIARPLMLSGLLRTGSTKLQRVLATDSRWRYLPLWEALHPVPFPGEVPGDPSPRVAAAREMAEAFRTAQPQAQAGHPIFAEAADEEAFSSQWTLHTSTWFGFARTPGYMAWVAEHPMRDAYTWLRKTLQYIQWQHGGERRRWVLKCPHHIGYFDELCAVFPDMQIVQTHRAPIIDIVASCTQLIHNGRKMTSAYSNLQEEAQEVLRYLSTGMRKHMRHRANGLGERILDVDYRDILGDCAAVVDRSIEFAGMTAVPDTIARVRHWEAQNPQHAQGRFEYSAQACGLTDSAIRQSFGDYAAWLDTFMIETGAHAAIGPRMKPR